MAFDNTDENLHALAREAAKLFYPTSPDVGAWELVLSCDRERKDLYVRKRPMWQVLRQEYAWMIEHPT